jgi:hypothetical protein
MAEEELDHTLFSDSVKYVRRAAHKIGDFFVLGK